MATPARPLRRWLVVLGVAALASVALLSPGPLAAQAPPVPTPAATPTPGPPATPVATPPASGEPSPPAVVQPPPWIPGADYLGEVGAAAALLAGRAILREPIEGFQALVRRWFDADAIDEETNFLFLTPRGLTYRAELVTLLHGYFLEIALRGAAGALVLLGAFNLVGRRAWGRPVDEPADVLWRVGLAALAAASSLHALTWLGWAIEFANALNRGVLALPLCPAAAGCRTWFNSLAEVTFGTLLTADLADTDLLDLLAALVLGLVLLLWALLSAYRLVFLNLLIAVCPLAVMGWAAPQTRDWSARWGQAFVVTVLAQPLQVIAFRLGWGLLNIAPPPSSAGPAALAIQLVLGIATLALVLLIPGWLRGGMATAGPSLRVVTRVLAATALASRGAATAARVTAAAGGLAARTVTGGPPRGAGLARRGPSAGGAAPGARWRAPILAAAGASRSPMAAATRDGSAGSTPARPAPAERPAATEPAIGETPAGASGVTYYATDRATGRPFLVDPTAGLPPTADPASLVATFADGRPDRPLTGETAAAQPAATPLASPAVGASGVLAVPDGAVAAYYWSAASVAPTRFDPAGGAPPDADVTTHPGAPFLAEFADGRRERFGFADGGGAAGPAGPPPPPPPPGRRRPGPAAGESRPEG